LGKDFHLFHLLDVSIIADLLKLHEYREGIENRLVSIIEEPEKWDVETIPSARRLFSLLRDFSFMLKIFSSISMHYDALFKIMGTKKSDIAFCNTKIDEFKYHIQKLRGGFAFLLLVVTLHAYNLSTADANLYSIFAISTSEFSFLYMAVLNSHFKSKTFFVACASSFILCSSKLDISSREMEVLSSLDKASILSITHSGSIPICNFTKSDCVFSDLEAFGSLFKDLTFFIAHASYFSIFPSADLMYVVIWTF
jgi:hypothetical protein